MFSNLNTILYMICLILCVCIAILLYMVYKTRLPLMMALVTSLIGIGAVLLIITDWVFSSQNITDMKRGIQNSEKIECLAVFVAAYVYTVIGYCLLKVESNKQIHTFWAFFLFIGLYLGSLFIPVFVIDSTANLPYLVRYDFQGMVSSIITIPLNAFIMVLFNINMRGMSQTKVRDESKPSAS